MGNYAITPSGLSASNYTIAFIDGLLKVDPVLTFNPGGGIGPDIQIDSSFLGNAIKTTTNENSRFLSDKNNDIVINIDNETIEPTLIESTGCHIQIVNNITESGHKKELCKE